MSSSTSSPALSSELSNSAEDTITKSISLSSPEENASGQRGTGDTIVNNNIPVELGIVHPDAPSTSGSNLEEFQLFPKLPIELRLQIWRDTFPRPRVIALHVVDNALQIMQHKLKNQNTSRDDFSSLPPIPCALHANSESRAEALKSYELCFDSSVSDSSVKKIFVNFEDDMFWIGVRDRYFGGLSYRFNMPIVSLSAAEYSQLYYEEFITPDSAKDLDKIQRLVIGPRTFSSIFEHRVRKAIYEGEMPAPHFGLPVSLKELLVLDHNDGQLLSSLGRDPGMFRFENEEEAVEKGKNKNDAGEDYDHDMPLPHGPWWKKAKKEVFEFFEGVKQENLDWKAPSLRFCRICRVRREDSEPDMSCDCC